MKIWLLCHFLSLDASQLVTKVSDSLFTCSTLLHKDKAALQWRPGSVSHMGVIWWEFCWNPPAVAAQSTALAGSLADWESSSPSPRSSSSAPPPCLSPPPDSVVPGVQHMHMQRESRTSSDTFNCHLEWKQSFNCRKRLLHVLGFTRSHSQSLQLTWHDLVLMFAHYWT